MTTLAVAAMAACSLPPVRAAEIDTGNADLAVRWDNTVRANYARRVEGRDNKVGNDPKADEGDYIFDKGQAVAKRLDLLSELDVVYQKRYGFRVSGAAWYDGAYGDSGKSNPALATIPSYINNQFTPTIRHLYHSGGEVLDAFVFAGGDIGEVPVNGKLGRHTIYWGESVYLGGHMHSVCMSVRVSLPTVGKLPMSPSFAATICRLTQAVSPPLKTRTQV